MIFHFVGIFHLLSLLGKREEFLDDLDGSDENLRRKLSGNYL